MDPCQVLVLYLTPAIMDSAFHFPWRHNILNSEEKVNRYVAATEPIPSKYGLEIEAVNLPHCQPQYQVSFINVIEVVYSAYSAESVQ